MVFIRSFQTGNNAQFAQKILNEISAARVCLLNLPKKAFYDGTLQARMAAERAASGLKKAEPFPVVVAASADEVLLVAAEEANLGMDSPLPSQFVGSERSEIRKKKSKKATVLPLAALGAMLVVCVAAFAVVMSRKPETHVSQADVNPDASPPAVAQAPPHQASRCGQRDRKCRRTRLSRRRPRVPLGHPDRTAARTRQRPQSHRKSRDPRRLRISTSNWPMPRRPRIIKLWPARPCGGPARPWDNHQDDLAKKLIVEAGWPRESRTT